MTLEQSADEVYLDSLLSQVEGRNLEFKHAANSLSTEKVIGYCAALANERGGTLVLGVSDSMPRTVLGSNAILDPMNMEHRVHEALGIQVTARTLSYDSKRVVVFVIPSRRPGVPINYDGRYLVRAGESLVAMQNHTLAGILDESRGRPMTRAAKTGLTGSEVFQLLEVDRFFELMPYPKPPTDPETLAELVNREILLQEDGGRFGITKQGALFAARDLGAFEGLRLRRIRIIKYADASRLHAVFEHFEVRGYGVSFESTLALLGGQLPIEETIADGLRQTKPIYSPKALREFLANALIHQDFEEEGVQITIEIFEDRLEIRNPGEPIISVRRFVDETKARNPDLAELMRMAEICEIRGSGVDRALEQIEDLLRPAPLFRAENGGTTVILIARLEFEAMTPEDRLWAAYLHCCLKHERNSRLTNASLRERLGLPATKSTVVSQMIAAAVESGLIALDPRSGRSRRNARYLPFFAVQQ